MECIIDFTTSKPLQNGCLAHSLTIPSSVPSTLESVVGRFVVPQSRIDTDSSTQSDHHHHHHHHHHRDSADDLCVFVCVSVWVRTVCVYYVCAWFGPHPAARKEAATMSEPPTAS